MRILLDEQVPEPAVAPLRRLLEPHQVDHVQRRQAKAGYDVLVSADLGQLDDPAQFALVKEGGYHHVRFRRVGTGVEMTASAIATVVAGLPAAIARLAGEPVQRFVLLQSVRPGQYTMSEGRSMRP